MKYTCGRCKVEVEEDDLHEIAPGRPLVCAACVEKAYTADRAGLRTAADRGTAWGGMAQFLADGPSHLENLGRKILWVLWQCLRVVLMAAGAALALVIVGQLPAEARVQALLAAIVVLLWMIYVRLGKKTGGQP